MIHTVQCTNGTKLTCKCPQAAPFPDPDIIWAALSRQTSSHEIYVPRRFVVSLGGSVSPSLWPEPTEPSASDVVERAILIYVGNWGNSCASGDSSNSVDVEKKSQNSVLLYIRRSSWPQQYFGWAAFDRSLIIFSVIYMWARPVERNGRRHGG